MPSYKLFHAVKKKTALKSQINYLETTEIENCSFYLILTENDRGKNKLNSYGDSKYFLLCSYSILTNF